MGIRYIQRLFEYGNTMTAGLRGRGKDMLMANIVARRYRPYVGNIDYKPKPKKRHELTSRMIRSDEKAVLLNRTDRMIRSEQCANGLFSPWQYKDFDCGGNKFIDFVDGNVKPYKFPFPDGTDLYLSDCGVYFPAQYCNELNKKFPEFPTFMALSRHLGKCNVHVNAQNPRRVWDKIREQCDTYILCRRCFYIPFIRIVIQWVRIYDKFESFADAVPPFSVHAPLFAKSEVRQNIEQQKQMYYCTHGQIKSKFLIYRNLSEYDTRFFKTLMEPDESEVNEIEQNKN